MAEPEVIRRALEAILFVTDEPMPVVALAQILEADRGSVEDALRALAARYEEDGAGIVLRNVGGGWRLSTHPDADAYVERFVLSSRHARLTKAADTRRLSADTSRAAADAKQPQDEEHPSRGAAMRTGRPGGRRAGGGRHRSR